MDAARKILFADDASMFRELGALFLARSGRVLTARDGAEGLELARRDRPDVVVADLCMPEMDGESLCRAIRNDAELAGTPVILLTSSDLAEDHARAVRAGADDVLTKPLNRFLLIQSVNHFLRSGTTQGLARVALQAPVEMCAQGDPTRGRVVNLSRGGLFVAADQLAPISSEIELHFQLPEIDRELHSTAEVMWSRTSSANATNGMGMRFLALDRASARCIEEYVFERQPLAPDRIPRATEGAA